MAATTLADMLNSEGHLYYRGFRVDTNPRMLVEGTDFITKLELSATSPDGQILGGDSWEEVQSKIDAGRKRGNLPPGRRSIK